MPAFPLAPDPAVPHLARLLDPATVEESCARALGCPVRDAVPVKVKYRVGEHVRVLYDVEASGCRALFTVRSIRGDDARVDPDATVLEDLGAAVSVFPADRRLTGLRTLFAPPPWLSRQLDPAWSRSRLAGYAPEKAVVVQCLDASGRVLGFAKQFARERDAREALRLHDALSRACGERFVRLPRVLGFDVAAHILLTEAARGRRLTDRDVASSPSAMQRFGRAVAALHATPSPRRASSPVRVTADAIRATGEVLGRVFPARVGRVVALAEALNAWAPPAGADVTLHGDLHLKNALVDDGHVWLIDLDQVARGPVAVDLASFAALLRSHAVAGLLDRAMAGRLEHAFLEGYAEVGSLPPQDAFEWHVAGALFAERALRAVTRVRRPLLERFDALLDEAGSALRKATCT